MTDEGTIWDTAPTWVVTSGELELTTTGIADAACRGDGTITLRSPHDQSTLLKPSRLAVSKSGYTCHDVPA